MVRWLEIVERINKTKSWFFEKSNKICKLRILIKEKKLRKKYIINEKGNISIDSRDILKIIKELSAIL